MKRILTVFLGLILYCNPVFALYVIDNRTGEINQVQGKSIYGDITVTGSLDISGILSRVTFSDGSYMGIDSSVLTVSNNNSATRFTRDDSSTGTALNVVELIRTTSGTAGSNIGGILSFKVEDDGGVIRELGLIQCVAASFSGSTSESKIFFKTKDGTNFANTRTPLSIGGFSKVGIGGGSIATDLVQFGAGSSSQASMNIPVQTDRTTPDSGSFWHSTTQKALKFQTTGNGSSGILNVLSSTLFTSTADATIANTVTETTLLGSGVGTTTLPANFFVPGKTVRVRVKGKIANTGTPTIQIKAKLGSVAVYDTAAITMSTITGTTYFEADFDLTCRTAGSSGTVQGQGKFNYHTAASVLAEIASPSTSATTINTTISNVLDVTVTWGTASSSNTITSTNATVEVLN